METKLNPNLLVGDTLLEALATGILDKMVDARVVGDSLGGFAETLLGLLPSPQLCQRWARQQVLTRTRLLELLHLQSLWNSGKSSECNFLK